jgi:hypothetical protein
VRIVCTGQWLYDDSVAQPVDIVSLEYDFWYEIGRADGALDDGEEPVPLGPGGVLFYVRFSKAGSTDSPTWVDSGAYESIEEAQEDAQSRATSPIKWA